jgi:hypothetical protein
VRVVDAQAAGSALARAAFEALHPLEVLSGKGDESTRSSLFRLEGESLMVSGIKLAEDDPSGKMLVVRLYEVDGLEARAVLRFDRPVKHAAWVDVHEQPLAGAPSVQVENQSVIFQVEPHRVCSLKIALN